MVFSIRTVAMTALAPFILLVFGPSKNAFQALGIVSAGLTVVMLVIAFAAWLGDKDNAYDCPHKRSQYGGVIFYRRRANSMAAGFAFSAFVLIAASKLI